MKKDRKEGNTMKNLSKEVHNEFVRQYKLYEHYYNFNFRELQEFIKKGDVTKVKECEEYCTIYISKMIALGILYQTLTHQKLDEQSIIK